MTPEGRRVAELAFRRHAAELELAMAVLTAGERGQLHTLLKKLGVFAAGDRAETTSGERY